MHDCRAQMEVTPESERNPCFQPIITPITRAMPSMMPSVTERWQPHKSSHVDFVAQSSSIAGKSNSPLATIFVDLRTPVVISSLTRGDEMRDTIENGYSASVRKTTSHSLQDFSHHLKNSQPPQSHSPMLPQLTKRGSSHPPLSFTICGHNYPSDWSQ